ncbi:MAG: HAD hydrolase-like protein [Janthinobacterium lividum]
MPDPGTVRGFGCDLLVFDLDGTLVDSQQDLASSVNATLTHMGRLPLNEKEIAGFIGDGASMLLSRALEATGANNDTALKQALSFFLSYYRGHKLDTTKVYPGVLEALRQIQIADPALPMAILTNKPVGPSVSICDGLGLSPFFFANFGGDSFPTKKPDPLGLRTLMQKASLLRGFEVAPERTVLVGDSHVDVETARAAGSLSLGCDYGLDPVRLHAARPDAAVSSPGEWSSALQTLFQANGDRT